MSYKILGDYIRKVDNKNKDLKVLNLQGLSMTKEFRKSTSNIVGTDLSKYKIVKQGQFCCDFMSVIRVHKLPVVLNDLREDVIISPAYIVFEVIDTFVLLPEYLMLWFRRSEFDRYADFRCDSSIRGGFQWEELCEVELPIPSIEKQSEIVAQYEAVANKIKVNEAICEKLETTAQALYKQWFVDFEFPNNEGQPYKSSGGAMVFNEVLEKEIPEGWEVGTIGDLFTFQRGHDLPTQDRIFGEFPIFASTGIAEYHNEFKIDRPTIITGRSGSLGELFYYDKPCWPLNTSLYIVEFKKALPFYSLYFLQTVNLKELGAGSAVPTLNRNDIHMLEKEIPSYSLIVKFESEVKSLNDQKENYIKQNQKLTQLQSLLLSRLATLEG